MTDDGAPEPGWYDDPSGRFALRWWNSEWTARALSAEGSLVGDDPESGWVSPLGLPISREYFEFPVQGALRERRQRSGGTREPALVYGETPEPGRFALMSEPASRRLSGLYEVINGPTTWGEFYESLDVASEDVRAEAIRFFGLDLSAPFEGDWKADEDPRDQDPHPPPHCRFGYFEWWMQEGDWSWPGFPTECSNAELPKDLVDSASRCRNWGDGRRILGGRSRAGDGDC